MAKIAKEDIIASLKEYTVVELFDLVKAIETEFGVKAAAAVAAAPAAAKAAEGPSEVTVSVTAFSGSKVAVIKAVQGITGLGLMDAKKLIDTLPAKIKEKVSPAEADEIKKKLEAASCTVEVK
ncbi:MAG TPA: 50S ribosomal protein L7/L12 [Firmicutes bacterium]|nr:50S ribosomal protein L7/L12 [Bacillota bacterium]